MEFLETIENMAFPTWVRESPSLFAYTTILTLHAIGLSTVVGLNTVVALRLLGYAKAVPLPALRGLVKPMYVGFWINAISGVCLFWASLTNMVGSLYFWSKLGFVLLAMINLLYASKKIFTHSDFLANRAVPPGGRRTAWLALLFWGAAILCGRVVAYPGILGNIIGL
jgi:hypothetical protein